MRRIISIALIAAILAPMSEAHELLKVPHLIAHFVEHKENHSETNLWEYLHEHYCHEHEDHDQDEHHDRGCLPFQGNHACQSFSFCGLFFENSLKIDIQANPPVTQKHYLRSESFQSEFHANIWQPPKIG